MGIRIYQNSLSAFVLGYAVANLGEQGERIVWLDYGPDSPKALGAVWASLVGGSGEHVSLVDEEAGNRRLSVRGLNRRYDKFIEEAPNLVIGRARPKFVRLVAPVTRRITALGEPFVVTDWSWMDDAGQPQLMPAAEALVALLNRDTALPVRPGWGEYLLGEAIARGAAKPLVRGGSAPEGWAIHPLPWKEVIEAGVQAGRIAA